MISPSVGLNARRIVRPAVVLPEPLSPTKPRVSPWRMCRLIPSTAFTVPAPRPRKPCWSGKYFLRFFTSSNVRRCSGILFLRFIQEAAHGVLIVQLSEDWHVNLTSSRHHAAAARMEWAPAGSLEGAGNRSFNSDQALPRGLAQAWHGPQEIHGVGVLRVAQNLPYRSILHHLSEIHNGDRVGNLGDDSQIVSDEHYRHADPLLQTSHEIQDLCLDGHIERSRRFVGNQQGRITRQSHGNHCPLAHTA